MPPRPAMRWLWASLLCCVIVGSVLPGSSAAMMAVGRLHVSDKLEHCAAYLSLSVLAVSGFDTRRKGIVVGLSMFVLGVLLEGAQHFTPGRAVEAHDVVANGLGVSLGVALGIPTRRVIGRFLAADVRDD